MLSDTYWDKHIAVEEVGGVPFRMYTNRPQRIEGLLAFANHWGAHPYVVQGDRVLSFGALGPATALKAKELVKAGTKPGDRVFLFGWNSIEWIVNFWACVRAGAVPVLGNTWWSAAEVESTLDALGPNLVLADSSGALRISERWKRGPWQFDAAADASPSDWHEIVAPETDENSPAAIIFTSGTQGQAKGVVLAHRSLLAQLQMLLHVTRRIPYRPTAPSGEVSLHTGPLFHIGGIQALLRGVTAGNTLVLLSGRFDAGEALALIERHKVSRWNAVPTMATRILEHKDLRSRDLSSLTNMTLGGSAVHPELMDQIRDGLPGVRSSIATGYGLSENGGQATAAGGSDTLARPGSCGRPLPCVEVKIVPRAGLPDGEVLVRSPTQMLGYFGEAETPIDSDGWLHTGDLGRVDEEGHLWITGRIKDIIIRGGENISPAAVERALVSISGIAEAAVLGVPHPELGEEVLAVVVTDCDLTPKQIGDQLRSRVASFAVPTLWRLQRSPLPVNQTGKIDKLALKADFHRSQTTT